MNKILGVLGGDKQSKSRNDDDFSDRLSHRYSTAILVAFAIIVSTKQYVGEAINCWVPKHFTGSWEDYTNNYCWIRNTYYLPFEEYIPREGEDKHMIPYYQWVPMILLVQALFFYVPCVVWRNFNARSGIDVNNIVQAAEAFEKTEHFESRKVTLGFMAKQMDRYLKNQLDYQTSCTVSLKHCLSRTCCACCGRRRGNYLVALYILVKILYISNVMAQIFMLNQFLGTDFNMYGINVIRALARGEDWTASPRFPRVTMCDFKVRRLGNVQRYTVQCVLPVNLFNEKIYLILWFWFVFVATVACVSLVVWVSRLGRRSGRHRYIKRQLSLMDRLPPADEVVHVVDFVENYLKQDGCFVLRLLAHNTNTITLTEFVCCLWDHFRGSKMPQNKTIVSPEKLKPI